MDSMLLWFQNNIDIVFFIYGLAFFVMGGAISIHPRGKSKFILEDCIWLLAGFAYIHGINEWLDMWAKIKGSGEIMNQLRWFCLVISYLFLFEFGRKLLKLSLRESLLWYKKNVIRYLVWPITPFILLIIFIAALKSQDFWKTGHILARYLLGFTGSFMTAAGFFEFYHSEEKKLNPLKVKKYFFFSGLSFFMYGIFGGLIVPKGDFFPANWLNADSFLLSIHMPVQIFRAVLAIIASWSVYNLLRIFNFESTEKIISESEEKFTALFEHSSDGITLVDPETGHIILYNKRYQDMLGYSDDELKNMTIIDFHPQENREWMLEIFNEAKVENSHLFEDIPMLKKDGAIIFVDIGSYSYKYTEKPFIIGNFRDITERIQLQEGLNNSVQYTKGIIDSSMDMIIATNKDGMISEFNISAQLKFQYNKEEIIGRQISCLFSPIENAIEIFEETIKRSSFKKETISISKKGEEFTSSVSSSVMVDINGEISGIVCILRDITQREKMEREQSKLMDALLDSNRILQQSQKQLIQSEKMAPLGLLVLSL